MYMECYKEVDETPVIFAISSVYVVQTNKVYTVERLISCSSTMYRNIIYVCTVTFCYLKSFQ